MSNKKGKYYFDVTIFASDIFISFLFWCFDVVVGFLDPYDVRASLMGPNIWNPDT